MRRVSSGRIGAFAPGLVATTAPPWSAGADDKVGIGGAFGDALACGAGMLGGYLNRTLGSTGLGAILGATGATGAKGVSPN